MDKERSKRVLDSIAALAAVALVIVTAVTFYWGLSTTNRHMEINLARDLLKDFFDADEKNSLFRDVRRAIERCEPLYKSWGGQFSNDEMNRYLGFFEDLGFYWDRGVLTLDTIDHGFGSYLIEAFEHPHVKQYIADMRSNARQSEAFWEFGTITKKVEDLPHRSDEVERTRQGCSRPQRR